MLRLVPKVAGYADLNPFGWLYVKRYLDDARALAKTEALPLNVQAVAVAGLCRGEIEAACVRTAPTAAELMRIRCCLVPCGTVRQRTLKA